MRLKEPLWTEEGFWFMLFLAGACAATCAIVLPLKSFLVLIAVWLAYTLYVFGPIIINRVSHNRKEPH